MLILLIAVDEAAAADEVMLTIPLIAVVEDAGIDIAIELLPISILAIGGDLFCPRR